MSKLNNLKAEAILAPFKADCGNFFDKLCQDVNSNLGRLEKDILTKSGEWKVGTKGKLLSKDGHTLQLPLNAAWTPLVQFGIRLMEIQNAGSSLEPKYSMQIEATIPAVCTNWIDANYRNVKSVAA